jgi:hypothetical protein
MLIVDYAIFIFIQERRHTLNSLKLVPVLGSIIIVMLYLRNYTEVPQCEKKKRRENCSGALYTVSETSSIKLC